MGYLDYLTEEDYRSLTSRQKDELLREERFSKSAYGNNTEAQYSVFQRTVEKICEEQGW